MVMKHVRTGEVDTPEEVAREMNRVIDNVNQNEAKVCQIGDRNLIPAVGEIVVIVEDAQFCGGIVTKYHDEKLFEVVFFDGDDGCYGIEDLACNAGQEKGAKDA
jgi:hypothetical protein